MGDDGKGRVGGGCASGRVCTRSRMCGSGARCKGCTIGDATVLSDSDCTVVTDNVVEGFRTSPCPWP